jgi:hypothetical protein
MASETLVCCGVFGSRVTKSLQGVLWQIDRCCCEDMAFALAGAASGGAVPDVAGASHPPLEGGHITGHGGAALRLYAGMTQQQATQFEAMGQVEAPVGRGGQAYWALKTGGTAAAQSVVIANPGLLLDDVVLKPVTVTHVGVVKLVQMGYLYCVDANQWRLYAPLPAPRDHDDNVYYEIHPSTQLE